MRMSVSMLVFSGVLVAAGIFGAASQGPKYGVTVSESDAASLTKAKTYGWTTSQPSANKTVDAQIVAAVDRELMALGLSKVTSGKSDLLVTYVSQRRTDVDVNSKKSGAGREYAVGILIVELRDATTAKRLFRVRLDQPIDTEPEKAEAAINAAAKAMFEKYPTRGRNQ